MNELPQFARDLLSSPPRAGTGVHSWLFRTARVLHAFRTPEEISDLLNAELHDCGRTVPKREIDDAIKNSNGCAWNPKKRAIEQKVPTWPKPDWRQVDNIVRKGYDLADLWEDSPIRFSDLSQTEFLIDALFPGNPFLCVGKSMVNFLTLPREFLRDDLNHYPLIVPSPMSAIMGETQAGKLSAHSLDNTGARKYLVVEFDFKPETEPTIAKWIADEITVADACAALLQELAQVGPLALAVFSGSKSVHGWFPTKNKDEVFLRAFMRRATRLGADPATFTKSQFVRMPDALRPETGIRQTAYFFNPEVLS